ncbi:MAG TPA: glycine--tRNA ligase subunit beta, partial [Anaerolineales bacterium]|nr:glycine--tRNA ligase subunit beta [Anaerolineales bacterium]
KYIDQRRALEFPWRAEAASMSEPAVSSDSAPPPDRPEDFVLEIGTEELPHADVDIALGSLAERLPVLLQEHRLSHGAVRASGTPRRLAIEVAALAPAQGEIAEWVKGPPEARAFDAAGQPTQAALGWARKLGLSLSTEAFHEMVRDIDGGRYLAAEMRRGGEPASAVLSATVLPRLIADLSFDSSMRWIGAADDAALRRTAFARPIRWLMALHGEHIVPIGFAGLRAGRTTRARRFLQPATTSLDRASDYRRHLNTHGVMVDPAERRRQILDQARGLAAEVGGAVEADEALVAEVTQLVEEPTALRGSFDEAFLSLPPEVLVAVMKKHQRYLPIRDGNGGLLPHFVAVRNGGTEGLDSIRAGNEHVLRARFADADFFLRKDRQHPLEHFRMLLARLTFQARLGSYLDKTERIEALVEPVGEDLGLSKEDRQIARRAAHLCKFDLATALVAEMTSLQGVLGRIYALERGEAEAVAQAIFEHHLPRFAGDALPESLAGITVGLADRLDTLAGLFGAGMQPSGARDPFALRRTAVGLVQILVARGLRADLERWLDFAARRLPWADVEKTVEDCLQFIAARQEAVLLAEGRRYDVVAAVLAAQRTDPAGAARSVRELEQAVVEAGWPPLLQAYARCARIVRGQKVDGQAQPARYVMEAEKNLHAALDKVRLPLPSVGSLVTALKALVPPITEFFDKVLVMDEDSALRANRLALVQRVVSLADGLADFSKLEGF